MLGTTLARRSLLGECEGRACEGVAWVGGARRVGLWYTEECGYQLLPAYLSRGGTDQAEPAGVWAFPILVVVAGCNVTSVDDFCGSSLERSGVHGCISVEVVMVWGRWFNRRSASPSSSQGNGRGARRKEIGAAVERHTKASVTEAFFLEEVSRGSVVGSRERSSLVSGCSFLPLKN